MDGQNSRMKLPKAHSSLLLSSPTFRPSAHNLSQAVGEEGPTAQDPKRMISGPGTNSAFQHRTVSALLGPVLAMAIWTVTAFLFFDNYRREDTPTSESLQLALIFLAITIYFISRKRLIRQNLLLIKSSRELNTKRIGFPRKSHRPVEWFIGDGDPVNPNPRPRSGAGEKTKSCM